jgi:hypothetical protein
MLVQAGVRLRPRDGPNPREGVEIDPALRPLFFRAAYGFDPRRIRAVDYLTRYPFSSVRAIERQLDLLVDAGVLTGPQGDAYALTDAADARLREHTQRVGEWIDRLDLGDVGEERIGKLLAYDHRILDGIRKSVRRAPSPIFEHRLRGVHPEYDPPRRWHHWQLAWTMVAAHEDAEEEIRARRGIPPLVWFARHEFWFTSRLPHRSRMRMCADLRAAAERYAPLERPEAECRAAVEAMRARGWLEGSGDDARLSEAELSCADRDEAEIEAIFLARWPRFSADELRDLRTVTEAINGRCEELLARPGGA